MSNKKPDMSAFVGRDFDCEFLDGRHVYADSFWIPAPLFLIDGNLSKVMHHSTIPAVMSRFCRPRLNKPQVLTDYSWLPDGFVYVVRYSNYKVINGVTLTLSQVRAETIHSMASDDNYVIEWVMITGVTKEYADWGNQHGMEVVE